MWWRSLHSEDGTEDAASINGGSAERRGNGGGPPPPPVRRSLRISREILRKMATSRSSWTDGGLRGASTTKRVSRSAISQTAAAAPTQLVRDRPAADWLIQRHAPVVAESPAIDQTVLMAVESCCETRSWSFVASSVDRDCRVEGARRLLALPLRAKGSLPSTDGEEADDQRIGRQDGR